LKRGPKQKKPARVAEVMDRVKRAGETLTESVLRWADGTKNRIG
jgi:hypothetical protein